MNFGPLTSPSPQLPHHKPNLTKRLPPCRTPLSMYSDATSSRGSGSGPSSCSYTDFHPLQYPHVVLSQDNTYTNNARNNAASASPIFDASDMSASDFFTDTPIEFLHPGTPSSASSGSGLMTPVSARGVTRNPAIANVDEEGEDRVTRSAEGGINGHHLLAIPVDYSDSLLPREKSSAEEPIVDWPQLLAALYIEHPDTARWFAQTRTSEPRSATAPPAESSSSSSPQDARGVLLREEPSSLLSPLIYPQELPDTLAEFLASLDSPPSSFLSPTFAAISFSEEAPSQSAPLHQPQPIRPIPQVMLQELAAAASHLPKFRDHARFVRAGERDR